MKKIISIILLLAMMLSFASCEILEEFQKDDDDEDEEEEEDYSSSKSDFPWHEDSSIDEETTTTEETFEESSNEESSINDSTSTEESSNEETSVDDSTSTEENSSEDGTSSIVDDDYNDRFILPDEVFLRKWEGKTLNVLATKYGSIPNAPWGQLELNPESFGTALNTAFENRQATIKELYGVTVKWTAASQVQSIVDDLAEAKNSDTLKYDIALPRVFEVQSLAQSVYDMGNSDYIDFNQSYFSQIAYEAFTVAGVTLFATGDFDFMDDQLANVIFYNKDMFSSLTSNDIYELVDDGGWTIDIMTSISRAVTGDLNNNNEHDDEDRYGFATTTFDKFFQFFGLNEVSVVDGLYAVTLDKGDPNLVVEKIITCATGKDWCRNEWGGKWGANMGTAFTEGRLLFCQDSVVTYQNFNALNFELGILPFPKLNEEQENYCAPVLARYQATVICIPKVTQDREMSEYFVSVLAWTGQEFIIPEFENNIENCMSYDYEEDMRIYREYIKPNMTYDVGVLTGGHDNALGFVRQDSYKENKDNFSKVFGDVVDTARNTVELWSINWAAYADD